MPFREQLHQVWKIGTFFAQQEQVLIECTAVGIDGCTSIQGWQRGAFALANADCRFADTNYTQFCECDTMWAFQARVVCLCSSLLVRQLRYHLEICRPAQMNGHVCQGLEFMHANRHALVERYDLLSSSDRSIGSFGIVQIATVKRMPVRVAFVCAV